MKTKLALLSTALLTLFIAGFGCDIDSGDDVVRETGGNNISGLYRAPGVSSNGVSAIITPSNTGNTITTLNLIQNGDQLEVITNDGLIFRGTIGRFVGSNATFSITGKTSAGNNATLSGNIRVDGTTATMTGTWVETSLFGTVTATANVAGLAPSPTPTPNPSATATPTP